MGVGFHWQPFDCSANKATSEYFEKHSEVSRLPFDAGPLYVTEGEGQVTITTDQTCRGIRASRERL